MSDSSRRTSSGCGWLRNLTASGTMRCIGQAVDLMRIGSSLALFTFGAILAFAIHALALHVISLGTIGIILMFVAVVGQVLSQASVSIHRHTSLNNPTGQGEQVEEIDEVETVLRPSMSVPRDGVTYVDTRRPSTSTPSYWSTHGAGTA